MKKVLSFLLCLVFIVSLLASCGNDESHASSEISQVSKTSDFSQEIQIPEKVMYYTGVYDETQSEVFAEGIFIGERYSGSVDPKKDLVGCVNDDSISDDTYFLIAVYLTIHPDNIPDEAAEDPIAFAEQRNATCREIFKKYDYIEVDNYFAYNYEYNKSPNYNDTDVVIPRLEEIFAGTDINVSQIQKDYPNVSRLCRMGYDTMGYISAGAIRRIVKEVKLNEMDSLCMTWCPAPDDMERWLTVDPDYRE